jgi:hypothetical protein
MNSGQWLISKPQAHTENLNAKAQACGSGFRPLIRMLKHWSRGHSDLIESYHIEAVALSVVQPPILNYPYEVYQFFEAAIPAFENIFWYEGSFADDYLTTKTRSDVVQRLRTARDLAQDAWLLDVQTPPNPAGAIAKWRQLFGNEFPAYG